MKNYKVAVINSNDDIVEALSLMLVDAGMIPVSGHIVDFKRGKKDILDFFEHHSPDAVIWDVAPPYENNWKFLQVIKSQKELKGIPFVVTATNKKELEKISGGKEFIEIIGKPEDMNMIIQTVKEVIK